MTAADFYIREPSDEWEVVERWENEGGRLRQNAEANYVAQQTLDSVSEAVAMNAHCPVVVARGPARASRKAQTSG